MTPRQTEALLKIRNYPELEGFRELLQEHLTASVGALAASNDDRSMVMAQGAYRAVKRIQDLIEDAERTLGKQSATSGVPRPGAGF